MKTETAVVTYRAKCPFCGYVCELDDGFMIVCIHYDSHDAYEATFKSRGDDDKAD